MSRDLVNRWRRRAQEWQRAGDACPAGSVVQRAECFARADALRECAESLHRSIVIAAGKPRTKGRPQ